MTITEALTAATHRLSAFSTSPRLDAELLLGAVLHRTRTQLLTNSTGQLARPALRRFKQLVTQRQRFWPIPYLTGRVEFFGASFRVNQTVLIPRPATELLIEAALKLLPHHSKSTVVDVGTGSGAIAITLALQRPQLDLHASDISAAALRLARRNAQQLGVAPRITWHQGSLLRPISKRLRPTMIIANLPYLTTAQLREPSIRHEPRLALAGGRDGLRLMTTLLTSLPSCPTVKTVLLEYDPHQHQALHTFIHQHYPTARLISITDGHRVRGAILDFSNHRAGRRGGHTLKR